ncbi:MAG: hypothetical protein AB2L21_09870 [Anaerolineaceae bacterium]
MISLSVLFYMLITIFIVIGAMRGWSKEVVVCASGIFALFIIEMVIPKIAGELTGTRQFWVNFIVLCGCAFFGYQTPSFQRFMESGRFERSGFRDFIMGALMGAVNGYIFISSAWYYLAQAGYPFAQITAPDAATEAGQAAIRLLGMAFPNYVQPPVILYAVAVAFIIVIGVFI